MNDATLRSFIRQAPDRDLDRLETDVWAGIAERSQARRAAFAVAGAQIGLACLVLIGSLTVGRATVAASAPDRSGLALMSSAALAPSTLLVSR